MRTICFDTETTGLDARNGDRVIELGCVELINLIPTGKEFHRFINPERSVSADTIRITGITDDMLVGKPTFSDPDVYQAFLDFIGDAPLVAHNAEFDRGFINEEFSRIGLPALEKDRFIDTLAIAKKRYPGASNTLDALCKRFDISIANRQLHGAVLDSQLLAAVYLELNGGRARAFDFDESDQPGEETVLAKREPRRQRPNPLPSRISEEEAAAHTSFVDALGENAVWRRLEKRET